MSKTLPIYTLVGSGRLALHLRYYFSTQDIPLTMWARKPDKSFNSISPAEVPDPRQRFFQCAGESDVILLAVSDQALPEWVERPELAGKCIVHFAGSRSFPKVWGFHPLMTFSQRLYPPAFYREIPFIADAGFRHREFFPFLNNPVFEIDPEQKPLYHALCHMAANFPALLWVRAFSVFERELKLPREVLSPILQKIVSNTLADGEVALAGPLRRGDLNTIALHEDALAAHPSLASVYRLFTEWAAALPPSLMKTLSPMEKTL